MRTEAEIISRVEALSDGATWGDLDGRRRQRLIRLLPYSAAKKWLNPQVTEADWCPLTALREECNNDLSFAWEKALDHRGLSADVMACVMEDWVWLLCRDEEYQQIVNAPYQNYGAPKLALAGRLLDMAVELDAFGGAAASRMAKGEQCCPACASGCDG